MDIRSWLGGQAFSRPPRKLRGKPGRHARLRVELLEERAMLSLPAFPGAEGYGAYAVGGRGGDVYHVTSLLDNGVGSLRYGIDSAAGPRTIVFDVAGNIHLESDLYITKPYLTIAGQTAPGMGITICNNTVYLYATHDIVVRYLRFRHGDIHPPFVPGFEKDTLTLLNVHDVILDHLSVSWGLDETLSVLGTTKYPSDRVTVQWSMITEGLRNAKDFNNRSMGSLITCAEGGYTFHHNLFASNDWRSPQAEGEIGGSGLRLDFVDNVVYNWGALAGESGPDGYALAMNYVNNYVIAGPSTPRSISPCAFWGFSRDAKIYQSGNLIDSDHDGRRDGRNTGWRMFYGTYTKQSTRFSGPAIQEDDAATAYRRVLAEAGASWARDSVDARLVDEVISETGEIISSQDQVGGWPDIPTAAASVDSDLDGMPDAWELAYGLDAENPSDRNGDLNGDGYTNLEEYLNGRSPVTSLVAQWKLDDGCGSVAADSAACDDVYSGTLLNGATFLQAGRLGGAVALDGVNDYISLPSPSQMDLGLRGQRTISVWFKATDATLSRHQVVYSEGSNSCGVSVYLKNGRLYAGGWNLPSKWKGTFLKVSGIQSGQWHQVVLVMEGGTTVTSGSLHAYLDGVAFGSGSGMQTWSHGLSMSVGGTAARTRFHNGVFGPKKCCFFGMIDDVRIYNDAMTPSEVLSLYEEVPVVQQTIVAAADATVKGFDPTDQTSLNSGNDASLLAMSAKGTTGSRGTARLEKTYIRFDLPSDVGQITDARLELFSTRNSPTRGTFQVFALREAADYGVNGRTGDPRLDEAWNEGAITFNNAPGNVDSGTSNALNDDYADLLGSFRLPRTKGAVTAIDSTAALVDFLNSDATGSVTFIIVSSAGKRVAASFASKEAVSGHPPQLICQYVAASTTTATSLR